MGTGLDRRHQGMGWGMSTTPAEKTAPRANMGPLRVACRDCQHFTPNPHNPEWGIGTCAATLTRDGRAAPGSRGYGVCYPMAPRQCPSYQPRNER